MSDRESMSSAAGDVEARLRELRSQIEQLERLIGQGVPVETARDSLLQEADAIEQRMIASPRGQQVAGDNNVTLYIEQYVAAPERDSTRALFQTYLARIWAREGTVSLLAAIGDSSAADVPLSDVYTALDVTAEAGVLLGEEEGGARLSGLQVDLRGSQPQTISGLRGEEQYMVRLAERIRREADQALRHSPERAIRFAGERDYRRRLTAVEAAAAVPRLVLLGPAGSGKSTFARHLALCMAGQFLGRPSANLSVLNRVANAPDAVESAETQGPVDPVDLPWPYGVLLPIFVELRRFVASKHFPCDGDGESGHLLDYIHHRDPDPIVPEFWPRLQDFLVNGQTLLVLDGLDEVPQAEARRERLRQAVSGFVRAFPACRVIVTSRPYAYAPGSDWRLDDAGFLEATLAPFDTEHVSRFIDHAYAQLAGRHASGDVLARSAADLKQRIAGMPFLQPLVERPLLLTMITGLYASQGGTLPRGRAELYGRSVEILLDRWNQRRGIQDEKSLTDELGMTLDEIGRCLEELAYEVHKDAGKTTGESGAEIPRERLWQKLDEHRPKDRKVRAAEIMDYLHERSGILVGESPTIYRFPHRSYQEYLAARHLKTKAFPKRVVEEVEANPVQWREVALFVAGMVSDTPYTVWALLEHLVPQAPPDSPSVDDLRFWKSLVAGLAIEENALHTTLEPLYEPKQDAIRRWLRATVELGALPPLDRAAAGRVLALLSDDRPGVGCKGGIPEIAWVPIPGGPFQMGSDPDVDREAFEDEQPLHSEDLGSFRISRYPITVAQFRPFVEGDGYSNHDYWTGSGLKWRGKRVAPELWDDPHWALDNHPVVGVSWFEAHAYCRWLSARLGCEVRLPTEAEWEKAARGVDGRIYPWGNEYDADRCNVGDTGIGRTSAVGMFPLPEAPWSDAANGPPLDMIGNVWEWCATKWRGSYSAAADDDPEGMDGRVLRGAAFGYDRWGARCAARGWNEPDHGAPHFGFRVAAPISSEALGSDDSGL